MRHLSSIIPIILRGLVLDNSSFINRIPSFLRRLGAPFLGGLLGIFVTISVANIPHSYSSLVLLAFLMIFVVAHVFWFHKIIQTLRQDFKTSTEPARLIPHSQSRIEEDNPTVDVLIEATFFQLLRDHLSIDHPPHIQAQSLQDDKKHLVLTEGVTPLLRENQLEVLAQPIVNLPQKRLRFFKCVPCVTVENGMVINLTTLAESPDHFQSQQAIDRMVLFQTLQFVRRHHQTHPKYGFVCTLSPTIYKDLPCLEEVIEFLHKSHFPFQGLILEVPIDIADSLFTNLSQLKHHGVQFIGKWQDNALPNNLSELAFPPVDFINLPYPYLSAWLKAQPHRQGIESLHEILEITPQTIISQVDKEQDLYQHLPVPFDFASGNAFGLTKPFYHIQV
jgi:hypothetical protein